MPRLTSTFAGLTDYQEGYSGSGPVFMGRRQHIRPYCTGMPVGAFLDLERRGEQWSYEQNKAFWAGAIDAGRQFVLLTDLNDVNDRIALQKGYVGDELFWLQDNGYGFEPDPTNPGRTLAIPPSPQVKRGEGLIRDYNKELPEGTERHHLVRVQARRMRGERFQKLVQSVLAKRPDLSSGAGAQQDSRRFRPGAGGFAIFALVIMGALLWGMFGYSSASLHRYTHLIVCKTESVLSGFGFG